MAKTDWQRMGTIIGIITLMIILLGNYGFFPQVVMLQAGVSCGVSGGNWVCQGSADSLEFDLVKDDSLCWATGLNKPADYTTGSGELRLGDGTVLSGLEAWTQSICGGTVCDNYCLNPHMMIPAGTGVSAIFTFSSNSQDECLTASDCEGLAHIGCAGYWECGAGQCNWVCDTILDCAEGDVRIYTCSDMSTVTWCTCDAGEWACVGNPEDSCPGAVYPSILIVGVMALFAGGLWLLTKKK